MQSPPAAFDPLNNLFASSADLTDLCQSLGIDIADREATMIFLTWKGSEIRSLYRPTIKIKDLDPQRHFKSLVVSALFP
jgi:hypothetical protein